MPDASVVAVRTSLVRIEVTVTVAPGSAAPFESSTVPVIVPTVSWAFTGQTPTPSAIARTRPARNRFRVIGLLLEVAGKHQVRAAPLPSDEPRDADCRVALHKVYKGVHDGA